MTTTKITELENKAFKFKDKGWRIDVSKAGKRKSVYAKTPREAAQKAKAWLLCDVTYSHDRLEDLWDKYIEELKLLKSESTYHQPESFGRCRIKPIVGKVKLHDFTDAHFKRVLDAAAKDGLSLKTLKGIKHEFGKFFAWCRRHSLTDYAPSTDVKIPGNARGKLSRSNGKAALQPKCFQILMSSNQTTYNGKVVEDDFVELYRYMAVTGLRPGEAIHFRNCDISKNYTMSRVVGSINIYQEKTNGKNDSAIRSFPNCKLAVEILHRQRAKMDNIKPTDLLFGCSSQSILRDNWYRYCEYNGIPRITPYELRHSFLSYANGLKYQNATLNKAVGHIKEIDSYIHGIEGFDTLYVQSLDQIFDFLLNYKETENVDVFLDE